MTASDLSGHTLLRSPGLQRLMQVLGAAGGEARIVGGAVRNALLGVAIDDIDLAVTLTPDAVIEASSSAGFGVHPTGVEHGTVTVVADGQRYEVTTLREDIETDGRRARVAFGTDWEADARRRDFTMNALYCAADGKIFDPVGGLEDVLGRRVRFVGDARTRIREDYLRILRYFRLFAFYNDGPADAEAVEACADLADGLAGLSRERIGGEFCRLIVAPRASDACSLINQTNVSRVLFNVPVNDTLLARISDLDSRFDLGADLTLRLAACVDLAAHDISERLRLPNALRDNISALKSAAPPSPNLRSPERKVVLYQYGADKWKRVVRLAWAKAAAGSDGQWLDLLRLPDVWPMPVFPLSGGDVVQAGVEEGPRVGALLGELEDWWAADGFRASREELLERLSARR